MGEEGRRGLEWEERDQVGGEGVEGEGRGESEVGRPGRERLTIE